jgi:hypothetical protein
VAHAQASAQLNHHPTISIPPAFVAAAIGAALVAGAVTYQLTQPSPRAASAASVTTTAAVRDAASEWERQQAQISGATVVSGAVRDAGSEWERQQAQISGATVVSGAVRAAGSEWERQQAQISGVTAITEAVTDSGREWERQREQQTGTGHYIDLSPTAPELR